MQITKFNWEYGKRHWLTAMLLLFAMSFVPQGAWAVAGSDVDGTGFLNRYLCYGATYDSNNNGANPCLKFRVGYGMEYMGYKEGFMDSQRGLAIYASKDGGSHWTKIIHIKTNSSFTPIASEQASGCSLDNKTITTTEYTVGTYYHRYVYWYLPLQWRNCNIMLKFDGDWCYPEGKNNHKITRSDYNYAAPYTFYMRTFQWNGNWDVTTDGSFVIPYTFSSTACNTDAESRIWTDIDGSWSNKISAVEVGTGANGGYKASSYSFKLSAIGKSLRSTFSVQPYLEFRHDNDRDHSNGKWYYTSKADRKTFSAFPIATELNASFDQEGDTVTLKWKGDNSNFATGSWGTKWAIYRNGEYVASVLQETANNANYKSGQYVFYDTGFPHETTVTYEIYYIWHSWNEQTARVDELKSEPITVNTNRTVPVNNLTATSEEDRIVLTWTSDKHKPNWGHEFRIFVDNETTPVCTITPVGNQVNFAWIHRTTDAHTDRQNGIDENDVPYVEEPLNACDPHDYRVESWIGDKKINEATLTKRAIGSGTQFYSLIATKGRYPGRVNLKWHVNKQGSTEAKTYVIDRHTAENNSEEWQTVNSGMSSAEEYLEFNDDTPLPGVYYEYRVTVIDRCQDGTQKTNAITDIGFAQSTGTVSGRITFGSAGTAVANVDVIAQKTGTSTGDESQYHSMRFTDTNGVVTWAYPNNSYAANKFSSGDFSMQMWISPEKFLDIWFARFNDNRALGMQTTGQLIFCDGTENYPFNLYMKEGTYNHVALTRKGNTLVCCLMDYDEDGQPVAKTDTLQLKRVLPLDNATNFELGYFKGYVDEFRLWTKSLTEDEIKENFDHLLVGNEKGLETYWTFDEGLRSQFFDSSRAGTDYHDHHGKIGSNTEPANYTPTALKLKAKTDLDGNYIIQGVPFSGEGTTYAIIPQLGIHEFNPTQQLRFVSNNSLVHNSTDFTDISSFPVSGKVYYSGTDYPVEDVYFYIDGIVCSKNGEVVTTNSYGEYTISVPIGKHFIEVRKNGHVFVNNGRYPADPNNTGTMEDFDRALNLEFRDTTLVNFTGRVVGGDTEGEKMVGFPKSTLSKNNIGVTEMVLTPLNEVPRMNVVRVVNGTIIEDLTNQATVPIVSATDSINSRSWRGAGDDSEAKKLYIRTDSLTGEFSAMLPPLEYKVASMKLVYDESHKDVGDPLVIDLTNPLLEYSDTLKKADGTTEVYSYNKMLKQVYHSEPQFIVTQEGNDDGAFGIKELTIQDELGTLTVDDIYKIENGKPVYKYGQDENGVGAAVFEMNEPYKFKIKAYEEYINNDGKERNVEPTTVIVPLSGLVVTIDNALSNQQPVYVEDGTVNGVDVSAGEIVELQSNQLKLDDDGEYLYQWTAGLPNISVPYTRTISMTYAINDVPYQWSLSGMKGIVLGSLPTGNNFVTGCTDQLDMILRDPPGTGSSAQWTKGKVITQTTSHLGTWGSEVGVNTVTKLSPTTTTIQGTPSFGVINNLEAKYDMEVGIKATTEGESGTTWSRTIETSKAISTSSDPDYVGDQGDIFIGSGTNVIFGKARNLGFHRVGTTESFKLDVDDAITAGLQFTTEFSYTQKYVENVLIPNLYKLRNSLLTTVTSLEGHPTPSQGQRPVYLTKLSPDDPRFGLPNYDKVWGALASQGLSDDGPSYKMLQPANSHCQDSVEWYNEQIDTWKKHLRFNEEEKAKAYELRENKDSVGYVNYSFDAGASVTVTNDSTEANGSKYDAKIAIGVHFSNSWGVKINGAGVIWQLGIDASGGYHKEHEENEEDKVSFSYTLAEQGSDALTVDVYRYGAFGPIFRTRGGQTSNPYEGEVRAKYYTDDKGNHPILMDATMQIEVPTIDVDVPIVSDIPTGSAANYTLRLGNASEVGEDVAYRLFVLDGTNPDGAELTMDGKVISTGRLIKVPGNQTLTKSLQLRQTNTSILDYEGATNPNHELYGRGIGVVFASDSQPEDIADTIFIKAHFVPSSSPVTLELSNNIINTTLGTSPNLVLTFKDFDRNYHNLKAFRLQYKKQGSTDWTLLKEYVLNDADKTENNEMLPATGATVSYTKPMSSFTDGNYLFRCVSAATYGTGEVYRYSDEIALVKDMQKPRPIGQPEPADGILDIGDNISIVFNEDVIKGEITKSANFLVTGVLNGAEIAHETALSVNSGSSTEAAASTEASINLANKDFSLDAWMNITGSGTLLSHGQGTNKLTVGTNSDGKLVVTIAGNTYTSNGIVPTGEWAFLSMNVTADGKLSVSVATANETKSFFTEEPVVVYSGNGPLSVGCGSDAVIHELLLWDEAHDLTTALANRSKSKSPSTRHLIGYWKMDEGEGTSIRDYARSRNMAMPNETWYLNNENKAIGLDGSHYVSINTATLPITDYDDYAVEFWMRGDQQTGEAQLLQVGEIAFSVNADGQLQLTGKDAATPAVASPIVTTSGNLTDNAWHHIALNVLRQGAAAVYVDGKRCLTTNATNVGGINSDMLIVGARRVYGAGGVNPYTYDNAFTGEVDEIRLWGATMNADQLAKNRKVRFTGGEAGLVAYYPFETKGIDDYGQVVTRETATDLTGSGKEAELKSLDSEPSTLNYTDNAPALRTKPAETNVNFNFVASDTKIVIEIDEDPAIIEGCTLNFSIRSVRDLNGNYSEPTIWSAFINQKELVWKEGSVSCTTTATNGTSVTATIVNKGGKQQIWTLSGMPSWLQASTEYGTTNPLEETTVTFTVSPSTPIGKYEETIYLKDNDGIETPLTINVKVTGETPTWAVDPGEFEQTMNVIGSLVVIDTPSEDSEDIVAAFIDGECRGVAQPQYLKRFDRYFVTMDIYGRAGEKDSNGNVIVEADADKTVEFKVYDASTGIIYPVVNPSIPVTFADNSLIGLYTAPDVLTATDEIEQSIELGKGWNWMSLSVSPDEFTVPVVFAKANGKVSYVKAQVGGYKSYSNGTWTGKLNTMSSDKMYAVKTTEATTLTVTGHRVVTSAAPITVGSDWNWVGYNASSLMSVTEALAGMDPQNGDIIKAQRGIAYYDNHEWLGTLETMMPGKGYKIFSVVSTDRTFFYPNKTATGANARMAQAPTSHRSPLACQFTPVDYSEYSANMVLIAQVLWDEPLAGVELGVFAGDECRETAFTNEQGMVYITIPGDDPVTLTFRVATDEQIFTAPQTIVYETDAVYGSPRAPFIIDLSNSTGIRNIATSQQDEQVFDLQGRKVQFNDEGRKLRKGVYIVNGQKKVK